MWVFGYGSLMWDGWELNFRCTREEKATLRGYRRDFNNASVRRWGSHEIPGPTTGLVASEGGECIGFAFEFPDEERKGILRFLRSREGKSFAFQEKEVRLAAGSTVLALVALNSRSAKTFIGKRPLEERVRLARTATGSNGTCRSYVRAIREKLRELQIEDPAVEEFWLLVSRG